MTDESASAIDNMPDLLLVIRHPPHGGQWLREALDVALVSAAFGQTVALLFQGDGVYALLPDQTAGALGQKGTHPQLAMLDMYDIDQLWVSQAALEARGLVESDLVLPVAVLDSATVAERISRHAHCLIF